jgi:hypothetical protein
MWLDWLARNSVPNQVSNGMQSHRALMLMLTAVSISVHQVKRSSTVFIYLLT